MPCCLVGFAPPPAALHLLRRRRMASASSRAFQLRLNPLTGDSEWLVVEEADGEGEGEAPQPPPAPRKLLAATSYLDMLNDAARNRAYRRAIDAAVTDPSSHVLDIGSAGIWWNRCCEPGIESSTLTYRDGTLNAII